MNTRLMSTLLGVLGFAAFAAPQAETNTLPSQATAPVPVSSAETIPAPAAIPVPITNTAPTSTEAPTAPEVLQTKNVDEIDLEDDSALAAKKPTVKGNMDKGLMSLVDIECDEATLADILRQFRKTTNANIISDDSTNLQKRVSVSLKHVPWLQGMTASLGSRGFRIEEHDNIYRVIEDLQQIPVSTRTYTLNHASAKELAELFNNTYGRKDNNGKVIMPIATCFNGANVVVVTATDKMLSECEAIIKAVDKAVAQIYIEARFIELSNEAMHKLGMDWSQLESWGASVRNLNAGMEYNNGHAANYGTRLSEKSWNGPTVNNNTDADGKTTSQIQSAKEISTYKGLIPTSVSQAPGAGRTADNMSWHNARGFSGQLSVDAFRLAMSAFESMSDVKIFSNPKIIVSNGKEAKVDMTTKYPNVIIDSNYTGLNSQNLSISTKMDVIPGEDKFMFAKEAFFSWGIQLSVTPRISPDGLISVEIVPTISACNRFVSINSTQETDTPYTQYPIIEVQRLITEFTMKDGATAVIGGLSKTEEKDTDSGIPYLREIPWIGPKLFGWKSRSKDQKEILVFVTVGIANPAELPKDVGLPKNAVLGREYVTGAMLEPGDRVGNAADTLKLDLSPLDRRRRTEKDLKKSFGENDAEEPKGTVTITPVTE